MFRGEFFDYDPLTGLTEYYEATADGQWHIHTYQDVEPHLEWAAKLRNEGLPDQAWKDDGATVYAVIPHVVQADMFKRGINFMDPNDLPRVVHEMNTTYSRFKTTYKHHSLKNR